MRFMTSDQPVRPANIANIVAINQGRRPLMMGTPSAPPVEAATVADLQKAGHVVIDTRSSAAYGAAHVPGSLNVHLSSPEFEQRVGWVAPVDVPMILVVEREGNLGHAIGALAFVGLDARVAGYLAGGMGGWQEAGLPTGHIPQIAVRDLHAKLTDAGVAVLDVRERSEWFGGHIKGARWMSYTQLGARMRELELAPDAPLAVVCHTGARSSTAASILARGGFSAVMNVTGGMVAWREAGLGVE